MLEARNPIFAGIIPLEYEDYEISVVDRENIKWISHYLYYRSYESKEMLREHILILEHMQTRAIEALKNEESIGFHNVTLQHDYHRIKQLLQQLETQLTRIEEKK